MRDIDEIKAKIRELYDSKTEIHVNVNSKKPRINVENSPGHITGVYRNLFTIEANENGWIRTFDVQYTDLFVGKVRILEIEKQSE